MGGGRGSMQFIGVPGKGWSSIQVHWLYWQGVGEVGIGFD